MMGRGDKSDSYRVEQDGNEKDRRIIFELKQDEDGYPPAGAEAVWARATNDDLYVIDNIPFFAQGVSMGDVVAVVPGDSGQLEFDRVVESSGHSTIRVVVYDPSNVSSLREGMRILGCESELSHIPTLVAFDLPPQVEYRAVRVFLDDGFSRSQWDYEVSNLVHDDPPDRSVAEEDDVLGSRPG
jgi:hypothetical protein